MLALCATKCLQSKFSGLRSAIYLLQVVQWMRMTNSLRIPLFCGELAKPCSEQL